MRQGGRLDFERPDPERVAGLEFAQVVRVVQHPGPVEREDRIERAGQREQWKRGRRIVAQCAGPEQRVEVGAMVGVAVADEHGIDLLGQEEPEQPGQHRVARIDQQPESVVLEQIAAAGFVRRGPRAAAADDAQFHGQSARPSLAAIVAASTRPATPNLARIRETWTPAVLSLMNSSSPICRLVRPATTSRSTSSSRAVSS